MLIRTGKRPAFGETTMVMSLISRHYYSNADTNCSDLACFALAGRYYHVTSTCRHPPPSHANQLLSESGSVCSWGLKAAVAFCKLRTAYSLSVYGKDDLVGAMA